MTTQHLNTSNLGYETTELKLAALILAELTDCTFEMYEQANSSRRIIKINCPSYYQDDISKMEKDFINKKAIANVYRYNKALNLLRDRLRGEIGRIH